MLQYIVRENFMSGPVSDLYYVFSIANMLVLLARYLSGESESQRKIKAVSALIQLLRFVPDA